MKFKKRNKSIIYVNFPPYDNAGKILDFLKTKYRYIFHFSFNFHRLEGTSNSSTFTIIKNNRIIHRTSLFQILPPPQLIYFFIPIRSLIFLIQIIWYGNRLKKVYGKIDDYFTVNAYTAWCGLALKKLGFVQRTIFWVWDYYPPIDQSNVVMFMRWLYWHFDKLATKSDKVIFLNSKLLSLRKSINSITDKKKYPVVGIGTTVHKIKHARSKISLLFIGVLKRSQGLDLLIDNSKNIKNYYPDIEVHIIGSGPDEKYFKSKAQRSAIPLRFHGLMDVYSKKAQNIITITNIGIAMYKPEPGNVSYFGDPSKIKNYLSFGLPVITTDVFEFAKEIRENKAGLVIPYEINPFIRSLKKIFSQYKEFSTRSIKLAEKHNYKVMYETIFSEDKQ